MKLFRWIGGFVEQDTAQSSTRLCAIWYALASIIYAFQTDCNPIILAQLLGASALFAGLRKSTPAEPQP